jgi:hypothetical protein
MSRKDQHHDSSVDEDNDVGDEIKKYNRRLFEKKDKKQLYIAGAVLVAFVVGMFVNSGISGQVVAGAMDSHLVGEKVVNYINNNLITGAEQATLVSVTQENGLYQVTTSYQGGDIEVFATMDGRYLMLSGLVDMDAPTAPSGGGDGGTGTQAPKSDRPVVELFIWSYCPYGVLAQEALAEAVSLLEDSADFIVNMYHDGHGAYETQQNKIQACIQELDSDNYWDYAAGFVEDIYPVCGSSRDIDCDRTESINLMDSLGIDSSAVMGCVDSEGASLIAGDAQRASQFGVRGSPTLMINDVIVQPSSRTADAFKSVICEAFNDAPESCSDQLSSDAATAQGTC